MLRKVLILSLAIMVVAIGSVFAASEVAIYTGETQWITKAIADEQAAKDLGEEPVKGEDVFLKLDCHISGTTNHLRDGILAGLEEKIEKVLKL